MSETLQHLKTVFQNNFGSVMFLLVAGTIAFAFIGYLLFDYFRDLATMLRMKRRHRREAHEQAHHHS